MTAVKVALLSLLISREYSKIALPLFSILSTSRAKVKSLLVEATNFGGDAGYAGSVATNRMAVVE